MQSKQNDSQMQYPSFYRDVIGSTTYFKGFISPTEQEWVEFRKNQPPVFMRHEPCIVPLGYFAQPITFEQFYEAVADAVQARLARISNLVQQAEMNRMDDAEFCDTFYPDQHHDDMQLYIDGQGALIDYDSMPDTPPPTVDDFVDVVVHEAIEGVYVKLYDRIMGGNGSDPILTINPYDL